MNFKGELIKHLKPLLEIEEKIIEIPPDSKLGDFSVPCFRFAKILKKSPVKIAEETVKNLKSNEIFSKIINAGSYINFFVNKSLYIKTILEEIYDKQDNYGNFEVGNGKNIVIDYSSPNIAKPFTVAHIRSTVIGNSICKIYSTLGYNTIGINHLGDWGTQFGKLMVAYKNWGNRKEFEVDGINYLLKIYVEFGDKAKKNPELNAQAREWFKKLEDDDPEAKSLWKEFRDMSLIEFNKYYDELGIKFDYYQGESFYNDQLDSTVDYVESKVKTEISEGAVIIDLKPKKIKTPLLLRKSDGATTYHTRDIAAALYRIKNYTPDKVIYVVAAMQKLHFKQLFTVLGMLGKDINKFAHVEFGIMTIEGEKISTRGGKFILLRDVIDKAKELSLKIIDEKNPDLKDKENIARQVGIGAIIFGDLSNDRTRNVDFTWKKAISFEGETSPYIQYTHARACSIKRKANLLIKKNVNFELLQEDSEIELAKMLGIFPDTILNAEKSLKPHIIASELIAIAQSFNRFYNKCHIINAEPDLRDARLLLADCARIVIKKGLYLLGIEAPEEM